MPDAPGGKSCPDGSRILIYSRDRNHAAHKDQPNPPFSARSFHPPPAAEAPADWRIQYIQRDIRKLFLATGICIIAHQMAHQHLRNRTVDTVHRHMIAVAGRPAKRQLRHIAGTDDKTADLIGKVHQNQRSLACLWIFIRYIMNRPDLLNVTEMDSNCLSDIGLLSRLHPAFS